jgi:hypothetical protein
MGALQTLFYLALIAAIILGFALLLIWLVFTNLRRWVRNGGSLLTAWLIGGAVTLVLLVMVFGTAGVLYGFFTYGSS